MRRINKFLTLVFLTLVLVGGLWASSAVAGLLPTPIEYTFTQSGFDEDAVVTGSFVGIDLNEDGVLSPFGAQDEQFGEPRGLFPGGGSEILGFSMSFSGNSLVPAFSLRFEDLQILVFDLNGDNTLNGDMGVIEGITAGSSISMAAEQPARGLIDNEFGDFFYDAGNGPFGPGGCDGNGLCGRVRFDPFGGLNEDARGVPQPTLSATTQPVFISRVTDVPLPSSLLLFGLGLSALFGLRRR